MGEGPARPGPGPPGTGMPPAPDGQPGHAGQGREQEAGPGPGERHPGQAVILAPAHAHPGRHEGDGPGDLHAQLGGPASVPEVDGGHDREAGRQRLYGEPPAAPVAGGLDPAQGEGAQAVLAGAGQRRLPGIRLPELQRAQLPEGQGGRCVPDRGRPERKLRPGAPRGLSRAASLEPGAELEDRILVEVPDHPLDGGREAGIGPVGGMAEPRVLRPEPDHAVPGGEGLEEGGESLEARAVAEDPDPVSPAVLAPVAQGLLPALGRGKGGTPSARVSSRCRPATRPRLGMIRSADVRPSPGTSSPSRSLPAFRVAMAAPPISRAQRIGLTGSPKEHGGRGIDHQPEHQLAAGLEALDDGLARAGGEGPVDGPGVVAGHVGTVLDEVRPEPLILLGCRPSVPPVSTRRNRSGRRRSRARKRFQRRGSGMLSFRRRRASLPGHAAGGAARPGARDWENAWEPRGTLPV